MGERKPRPLEGKRVVVTRAAEQAKELVAALERVGAKPIIFPVIRIVPPEDYGPLDAALLRSEEFDWILFTSRNAVNALRERGNQLRKPGGFERNRVGVVGRATAEEARLAGFPVTHVASRPLGKVLVDDLAQELHGKRVFLPRSNRADPELRRALEACGARMTEVIAYRTITGGRPSEEERAEIAKAEAVLFLSPSAVMGFLEVFGPGAQKSLSGCAVAAVGQVTHRALRSAGLEHAIAAEDASVAGIVEALADFFQQREHGASTGAKSA